MKIKNLTRKIAGSGLAASLAAVLCLLIATPATAQDDPVSVEYTIVNTCFGGDFNLQIDGTTIANLDGGADCQCNPPLREFSTSAPADLALIGPRGCTQPGVQQTGQNYIAWIRADITRAESGTESVCIFDYAGGDCNVENLCDANYNSYSGQTFTSALTDTDGDSDPDCTDPDDDGDGILDGSDNCPLVSNPGQEDGDGNGTGDACQPTVVAVPWAGQPSNPHVVFNGGSLVLQAVASKAGNGDPVALASGTWNPGDGSGPQAINVSNSRALELIHTYNGAPGQPFTATVEVTDSVGNTYSDTFKVQVQTKTLDVEVNMAIDKALWHLHKEMALGTSGGFSVGNWEGGGVERDASATASVVQSFEVNGHREIGDPLEDPYVDNVARGLRWLQDNMQRRNIAVQAGGDPDTNGNGYGLDMGNDHPTYITGQIVDAFVASGTQNAVAALGSEAGRTYGDIVQDMMDAYSWGQHEDGQGGWIYNWNSQGGIDSSASQWWAIGAHAADVWDTNFTPQWVRDENWMKGIESLQRRHVEAAIPWTNFQGTFAGTPGTGTHGACSYRGGGNDHNHARTASCLVMMSANGIGRDNTRFQAAEGYERRNFTTGDLHGNLYPMFALTKAMRLAKNAAGESEPIELLGGDLDWYRADPFPGTPTNRNNGFARYLVGTQTADGRFNSSAWVTGHLSTAFGVIILSPTLFELSPIASCTADPLIDGVANIGGVTTFDGSGSSHQDPDYAGGLTYEWDFQDGDTASGVTVQHAFEDVGIYNVTLTVTDDGGLTNTTSCPVDVRDNDVPPNANIVVIASDPICAGDAVTLDGSSSVDLDNDIVLWEWDVTAPVNFAAVDLSGAVVDATAFFLSAGSYDIGLRVTDNDGSNGGTDHTDSAFTSISVIPADDPACNQPPVANSGGPYEGDEAGAVGLDASGSTDPDGDALSFSWTVAGAGVSCDDLSSVTPTCVWPDNGVFEVCVTVNDGQFSDQQCTTATINNVPPTVEAGDDLEINENESITLAASFTDPGTLDTHEVDVDWGDGSAHGTSTSDSHQYLDDNPTATPSDTYTVTVTVTDDDGGVGSDTLTVTVNNVDPVLGAISAPGEPVPVTDPVCASADFTEVGTEDTHAAEWDWGDSSTSAGTVTQGAGSGSVGTGDTDCHTYGDAGVYTLTLTVTDDDTGTDSEIFQYVVVYDPSAGFVTGGGWIDSPAGAYVADPTLTGTANFGFVAKYKKGQSVPTGSTEFQFQAGDINFHSNTYQWLVIAGAKAMFKGDGTINGAGNFGFLLKAIDEKLTPSTDVDLFSIKIWDKDNGDAVVYDNGLGAAEDEDPNQAISGGQIVIHKKK